MSAAGAAAFVVIVIVHCCSIYHISTLRYNSILYFCMVTQSVHTTVHTHSHNRSAHIFSKIFSLWISQRSLCWSWSSRMFGRSHKKECTDVDVCVCMSAYLFRVFVAFTPLYISPHWNMLCLFQKPNLWHNRYCR